VRVAQHRLRQLPGNEKPFIAHDFCQAPRQINQMPPHERDGPDEQHVQDEGRRDMMK
jgi:hypothetical protein